MFKLQWDEFQPKCFGQELSFDVDYEALNILISIS